MSFLEGFRNHRIGQHGEDRAGGNSSCCGNNFRSEAAEKCIADQCGSAEITAMLGPYTKKHSC